MLAFRADTITITKYYLNIRLLLFALNARKELRHRAETNGVIYQEKNKIVSECESDDLDVKFWHRLPEPPCL